MTAASNHIKSSMWDNKQEYPLTTESLKMLLEQRIPLIRLKEFATPQECEMLYAQSQLLNFNAYEDVSPKIEKVGITVFEYNRISKADYFKEVEIATKLRDSITAASFDPLQRIMEKFRECGAKVRIASEPFYGSYYAGLIRKIEHGTQIHIDFAPLEQSGWEICTITAQLSWTLYLKLSDNNQGKTCIYDRSCKPEDEQYKLDSYGYSDRVIADADTIAFQPYVGDVLLFNTSNFHYVEPMNGQRVAFTSMIGLLPNGEIIFWS
ncbi:2OG-Fe(II)-dependent halogenase WelO5 family protein [Nostoc sp.]|uniref:2OG-Fe(II)-dependent halogenase WelO5 family protein n=1 Tax=Nostoc sp. TaxID=1180 RepID=UPI002FF567CE